MELRQFTLSIDSISLYALYANACLGLQHPQNKGASREIALDAIKTIGRYLVDNGVISALARKMHEIAFYP